MELCKLLDDYARQDDDISPDSLIDKVTELKTGVETKYIDNASYCWEKVVDFIVDIVWLKDVEYQQLAESELRTLHQRRLIDFVQQLLQHDLVSEKLIKEKMEPEFIDALKLYFHTPEGPILFSSKTKRIYTSRVCKQQKFNRTAEESEGYAKLVLEVNRCRVGGDAVSEEYMTAVVQNIDSLIGYFLLDPSRVIDIVLDLFAFGVCGHVEYFMALIKSIYVDLMPSMQESRKRLSALVGWKFDYHGRRSVDVPKGYYIVAALLLKDGLVELNQILAYMLPRNSDSIEKEYRDLVSARQKDAQSLSGNPMLSGTLDGGDSLGSANKSGGDLTVLTSEAKPQVKPSSVENHKAFLCAALFSVGELGQGLEILNAHPQLSYLNYSIVHEIGRCVEFMLEPIYNSLVAGTEIPRDEPFGVTSHLFFPEFSKYFGQWENSIESITDTKHLLNTIVPFLAVIGPRLAFNISAATKITRLGVCFVKNATDASTKKLWLDIIVCYLLPTLSLSDGNAGFATELWKLVGLFPYKTRYTLYGKWRNSSYEKHPELALVKMVTISDTKKLLRRIATENIKQSGRKLCKLSCSNPLICFPTLIEQIQVYESLISPLADCLRYMTNLGFDVMGYCLINALADTKKDRLKSDGTHISMWLNSLALFSASMFQRHKEMELDGILDYMFYQGLSGNALDLIVLKELVTKMSGIEQMLEGFSEEQIQSMTGGTTLKLQALKGKPIDDATKERARRLARALIDTGLAEKLLILIAQQQQSCIYKSEIPHLKLLGSLYDQVQETLIQYVDFVGSHLEDAEYAAICPSLESMCDELGIDGGNAWFIVRKKIKILQNQDMETDTAEDAEIPARKSIPDEAFAILSDGFYRTFWSLDLYDIQVPHDRYLAEIGKLQKLADEIVEQNSVGFARRHDMYDGKAVDASKRKAQYSQIIERLKKEHQIQTQNKENMLQHLKCQQGWFSDSSCRMDISTRMIQHCIFPRLLFSANDAIFSAKFIFLIHSLGVHNFSTLDLLSKIVGDVKNIVPICSQNEAANYGRFLREIFENLEHWRNSEATYNEKAKGSDVLLPGCRYHFCESMSVDETSEQDVWQHAEFCKELLHKWHIVLYRGFVDCLESKEYMKMRNSIVILDKISEYFPKSSVVGNNLIMKVKPLLQEETREDMKVLLTRYNAVLQHNQPKWISEQEFYGPESDTARAHLTEPAFGIVDVPLLSEPSKPATPTMEPMHTDSLLQTPMKNERDVNETDGWQVLPAVGDAASSSESVTELQEEKQELLKKLTENKLKNQEQAEPSQPATTDAEQGLPMKNGPVSRSASVGKRRSDTDYSKRNDREYRPHPYKRNNNNTIDTYDNKRPRYDRPSQEDRKDDRTRYDRRDERDRRDGDQGNRNERDRRDGNQGKRFERRDDRRDDRPTRNRR